MMRAFAKAGAKLVALPEGEPLDSALWIDLWSPTPQQTEAVGALGIEVPTLADMEEIDQAEQSDVLEQAPMNDKS